MKNRTEMPVRKLRPDTVLERLWQYISIDFITKLLVSRGYDSILVIYDRFLIMLHFITMSFAKSTYFEYCPP